MFKFLALLFLVALFGFLLIGVLFGRAIRFFNPNSDKNRGNRQSGNNKATKKSPKKFSENEGEYVNYEEINDDK
ncbi:MAG: DUF4834 family protein [Prevotella sp.]|jgi:hypothetical protein|nr:DUF4834 family protein [Prevotella sp.]